MAGHDPPLAPGPHQHCGHEERSHHAQLPLVDDAGPDSQDDGEDGLEDGAEAAARHLEIKARIGGLDRHKEAGILL